MTASYITLPEKKGVYRKSILRTILIGILLSVLTAVCLYLHHTAFGEYHAYLLESDKKNSAWIAEELGYLLPFLVIALFQYAVYHKHDRHDGILQREMAWEILIVATLTYLVLLPWVMHESDALLEAALAAGESVEKNDGGEYQTLWLDVAEWFIRFAIPLCFLYLYHSARAVSEKKQLEEATQGETPQAVTVTEETPPEEPISSAEETI